MVHASPSDVRYTVRQHPSVAQLSASASEALRIAHGFATQQRVDVWLLEGTTFSLLESHRPEAS